MVGVPVESAVLYHNGALMRKVVLKFGFIAGAILSGLMAITIPFQDQIGVDHSLLLGYTTMVVAFLMVYFGVRSYRDNVGSGRVTFGRAAAVGLLITLLASCCYVGTWEVIYFKFMPDFADKYAVSAIAKAKKSGAPEAQIAALTKEMDQFRVAYKNPLVNIAYTFLDPLPVGIVFALVTAGILSRKRKPDEAVAVSG